jgi:hypothetical protein
MQNERQLLRTAVQHRAIDSEWPIVSLAFDRESLLERADRFFRLDDNPFQRAPVLAQMLVS